ncbi:unnamed protein product [Larinioides sclopetarius]|uniref:Uncharacterized protein n=1 Tax=Larinioides sclopetarius TaxID=280406 RepID=A0AAV2BFW7_9ARAC
MDLFRRMDDMLSRMFSASFDVLEPENFNDQVQNESDPRAMMLKEPECGSCDGSPSEFPFDTRQPSSLIDSDIDDKVAKNKWLLKESPFQKIEPNFSYKRFSSIKTVRLPDGTLEEHRTVTDSQGNTTTTVRRSIGDQSYEVTTHSDEKGLKEKDEKFINMDENDLPNFEKKWGNIKSENIPVPLPDLKPKSLEPTLNPPAGDPSYMSLFKKFFGF